MFMEIKEMAELYKKIKSGEATEAEKTEFDLELGCCCFKDEYVIQKLEEILRE